MCTDKVLFFLNVAIQNGQVKIGRGLVLGVVSVVSLEDIVNNQRSPVEEKTGNLVRVRRKLLTSEESVENQTGIGKASRLDGQGLNGARVCRVGGSEPWKSGVVVRAVSRSVGVLVTHV